MQGPFITFSWSDPEKGVRAFRTGTTFIARAFLEGGGESFNMRIPSSIAARVASESVEITARIEELLSRHLSHGISFDVAGLRVSVSS